MTDHENPGAQPSNAPAAAPAQAPTPKSEAQQKAEEALNQQQASERQAETEKAQQDLQLVRAEVQKQADARKQDLLKGLTDLYDYFLKIDLPGLDMSYESSTLDALEACKKNISKFKSDARVQLDRMKISIDKNEFKNAQEQLNALKEAIQSTFMSLTSILQEADDTEEDPEFDSAPFIEEIKSIEQNLLSVTGSYSDSIAHLLQKSDDQKTQTAQREQAQKQKLEADQKKAEEEQKKAQEAEQKIQEASEKDKEKTDFLAKLGEAKTVMNEALQNRGNPDLRKLFGAVTGLLLLWSSYKGDKMELFSEAFDIFFPKKEKPEEKPAPATAEADEDENEYTDASDFFVKHFEVSADLAPALGSMTLQQLIEFDGDSGTCPTGMPQDSYEDLKAFSVDHETSYHALTDEILDTHGGEDYAQKNQSQAETKLSAFVEPRMNDWESA